MTCHDAFTDAMIVTGVWISTILMLASACVVLFAGNWLLGYVLLFASHAFYVVAWQIERKSR